MTGPCILNQAVLLYPSLGIVKITDRNIFD